MTAKGGHGTLSEPFHTRGQQPLSLPDGGRLWVDLDAIAGSTQAHRLGPAESDRPLWVRTVETSTQRRAANVTILSAIVRWKLQAVPCSDYDLPQLFPVVKELDGVFFWTGLTLATFRQQSFPRGLKENARKWSEMWSNPALYQLMQESVANAWK